MNVIKSRVSVRQYAQKPVEREKFDEILQIDRAQALSECVLAYK